MGEPCGMPRRLSRASVVRVFRPRSSVSSTGQSSHILIRCSTRRSTIRRNTDFKSSAWGMLPKEATTDYPSPWYSGFGNDHPRAPRLRRPIAGRDQQHPAARRPPRSRGLARRQPVAHSSRVDRLAPRAGGANTGGRCRRWRPRSGQTRGFASPAQGHRRSERPTHRVGAAKGERSCN